MACCIAQSTSLSFPSSSPSFVSTSSPSFVSTAPAPYTGLQTASAFASAVANASLRTVISAAAASTLACSCSSTARHPSASVDPTPAAVLALVRPDDPVSPADCSTHKASRTYANLSLKVSASADASFSGGPPPTPPPSTRCIRASRRKYPASRTKVYKVAICDEHTGCDPQGATSAPRIASFSRRGPTCESTSMTSD